MASTGWRTAEAAVMATVVIGAAGFVRGAVTRAALTTGVRKLRLLDRLPIERDDPRCELRVIDLTDESAWSGVLASATQVAHLMAPGRAAESASASGFRSAFLVTSSGRSGAGDPVTVQ
jgi:hypothetical protein